MKKSTGYALVLAAVLCVGGASVARVARGDDRTSAAALVEELEHDTAHKADTADLVKRARAAMERATRLRATGDETHAALADGLARQEAETARDLVRAIDAEKGAAETRRAATDAGVVGERERALLEEGIARNGRLRAEIERAGRPETTTRTSRAAGSDAGEAPVTPPTKASKSDGGAP